MFLLLMGATIAVAIFHIFVFHQYNLPWKTKLINKIPGPEGVIYFGSTPRYWNMKNEDRLGDICNMFKVHGRTFKLWFSGVPTVFISELDDYQTVLGSRLNSYKGIMYKHILQWLGQGLLTSSGHKWHLRRKIITPTFHFSILQSFVGIFNRNANILIQRLSELPDDTPVDLSSFVTRCTLDNVCETAMGTVLNSQTDESHSYVKAVFRMGSIVAERIFSPLLFPDVNFAMSRLGQEYKQILKRLHEFTEKIIMECKNTSKRLNSVDGRNNEDAAGEGIYNNKLSFLNLLVEKQREYGLSNQDIREEVDTFMFEGHDTTSMGISWALFELGCNPDIQDKCYQEQLEIFGCSQKSPSYKQVMQMHYLKRVIQESLRLHPSVPIISRKFDVDLQLKEFKIPAGTEIVMCLYHLHRNPDVYPDPEKFDPNRFVTHVAEDRHSFAYLPFSAGLRNCVGQKFAMIELLIILSSIIRRFQFKTLNDRVTTKAVPELTLRPANPLKWKITKRQVGGKHNDIGHSENASAYDR